MKVYFLHDVENDRRVSTRHGALLYYDARGAREGRVRMIGFPDALTTKEEREAYRQRKCHIYSVDTETLHVVNLTAEGRESD